MSPCGTTKSPPALPNGEWASESGFETKQDALDWGRAQETDVQRKVFINPNDGRKRFGEWVAEWRKVVDVGETSVQTYSSRLTAVILPHWQDVPIGDISSMSYKAWQAQLKGRFKKNYVDGIEGVMRMLLDDAVDERLIPFNPMPSASKRRRGRHVPVETGHEYVWPTPRQARLVAENARTLHDAVALACRAQDAARAAGEQPLVMSMLHLREAFAHAALRDARSCHQAVDRSRDQYERSRVREAEAPSWVRYFDETKLLVDTGIAYARLGEAARAEPLITEGLRREKASQQRGRAFHAFWLASTQLQQGKLDQACISAGLALDLTAAIDSPRVSGHVQELHRQMLPYAREAPVLAFEQRMRDALG